METEARSGGGAETRPVEALRILFCDFGEEVSGNMSATQLGREPETVASEIQTAVRHTAVYGVGSIVIKVLSFLMLPFYTHYLTPADYGVLEILDLSMSL